MNNDEFVKLVQGIVTDAVILKDAHTTERGIAVGYACVFCQSDEEYQTLLARAESIGKIIEETKTGSVFLFPPMKTVAGALRIIKVRKPDPTRRERGDADFNVTDYPDFKERYLNLPGFSLIQRENAEMIELIEPNAHVRCYFSNPPAEKQFGL
ncbi:MAG: hypothetical protein KBD27_01880 [Candidatus Moranbacteria bacterium]|nr:hypothetical protein [Candidatus Moranbacteria bacterium]